MLVGVVSLGCAKNLVDSEVILGLLRDNGFTITNQEAEAEVLIVNTCGFIQDAKEESIKTILELAAHKETGKCKALVVTGCLAQKYKDDLLREIPEVDGILGTGQVLEIIEVVQQALAGQKVTRFGGTDFLYSHDLPRVLTTPAHTAYVKIAEGCDNRCSYCVIPDLRGPFRSRPMDSIIKEIQDLTDRGVKEVNLIAQDTTGYGRDLYGQFQLPELLRQAVKISGLKWIRLLYCYPTHFTQELIEVISRESKICNYLDIPLQHINTGILTAMNRPDQKEEIIDLIDSLRQQIPGLALRTTFIVGFPGETEDNFEELLTFMDKVKFDRVGIFTYSQEEDTPAAVLADQIPDQIKQARLNRAMLLQKKISAEKNKQLVGEIFSVLIEGNTSKNPELIFGRTERDAPEIDGKIFIKDCHATPGQFVRVKATQARDYDLIGEVIFESGQ